MLRTARPTVLLDHTESTVLKAGLRGTTGAIGIKSTPKSLIYRKSGQNSWTIWQNPWKSEQRWRPMFAKNTWRLFWRPHQRKGLHDLCGIKFVGKSRTKLFGPVGEIRAKIYRTRKNLPAPIPIVANQRKHNFYKRWRHELRHSGPTVKIVLGPLIFNPALTVLTFCLVLRSNTRHQWSERSCRPSNAQVSFECLCLKPHSHAFQDKTGMHYQP